MSMHVLMTFIILTELFISSWAPEPLGIFVDVDAVSDHGAQQNQHQGDGHGSGHHSPSLHVAPLLRADDCIMSQIKRYITWCQNEVSIPHSIGRDLPSHKGPDIPTGQSHSKPFNLSTQTPPLLQGLSTQSLISTNISIRHFFKQWPAIRFIIEVSSYCFV